MIFNCILLFFFIKLNKNININEGSMASVQATGLYNNGYPVTQNTDITSNESLIYNNDLAELILDSQNKIQDQAIHLIECAFIYDEQEIDYSRRNNIAVTDPILQLNFKDGTKRYFRPCMIVKNAKMEDESKFEKLIEKYNTGKFTGVFKDQLGKTIAKIYKEFPKIIELIAAYDPKLIITKERIAAYDPKLIPTDDKKNTGRYVHLYASKLVRYSVAKAIYTEM
jgi:hypothetical protein